MKDNATVQAMEEARADDEDPILLLQRRFPWMQFASASLFVMGSVLYLVLGIEDYRWAQKLQDLPVYLRTADDDAAWVNYRLEERYNASLEGGGGGGRRLRVLRMLQFEEYQTNSNTGNPGIQQEIQGAATAAPSKSPLRATPVNESVAAALPNYTFTDPNPAQVYYNDWWADLPPGIQEAYSILGWTETQWNSGVAPSFSETPSSSNTTWDDEESETLLNTSSTIIPVPSRSPTTAAPSFASSPAPVQPTPAPVQPTPAPVQPTPAPVVATTSAPISTPAPTVVATAAAPTGPPTNPTPAELYYDSYWAGLPLEIQDAYSVLGYDATLWDAGGAVEVDDYYWDQMSTEQQEAALFIGYTKAAWDVGEEGTAAPTLEQTEEPTANATEPPAVATAATTTTNNNSEDIEPEAVEAGYYEDFDWDELSPRVQEAAVVLGYDKALWNVGGVAESDDYWWDELSPKQQTAAAILGYDKYSWNGVDPETGETTATDDYVSYDDDYVFQVKATGTWVSKYMILYFSAALCFVFVGVLDLIREKHAFHVLMIIAGLAGVASAMMVEKDVRVSDILNLVSVHFFMLEAFTLFGSHKREALATSDSESRFMATLLAFADLLFGVGALVDVIMSYLFFFDDTSDWDTNLSLVSIAASVLWLLCSLIYIAVFFYEYFYDSDDDSDLTNEKELHSSDEEVDVVVPDTTDGSDNRRDIDRTEEESTRCSPENSTDDMLGHGAASSELEGSKPVRRGSEISL